MIKYEVSKFNEVVIDKKTILIEKGYIQELAKKISNVIPQRNNRYNKTVVTKTSLGDIKLTLNKITYDNYTELIQQLVSLTNTISSSEDIHDILTSINSRTMFIDLSTKIYMELIKSNDLFLDAAKKDFNSLYDNINHVISLVSTETDYDKLCKNNKKLDNIKNKVIFYTTLSSYNLDTITLSELAVLIENILVDMSHFVKIEIVYNIISMKIDDMKQNPRWNKIIETLEHIREKEGIISNKILFKTMDILDLIENQI
tara:strand:- start:1615 stop:2388 length:774 start_codon:yes stop_codon:yes gene_type:complete